MGQRSLVPEQFRRAGTPDEERAARFGCAVGAASRRAFLPAAVCSGDLNPRVR